MDLNDLQTSQHAFDEKHLQFNEGFPKVRHILLHLTDSIGKIAAYCEKVEHGAVAESTQLVNEVIPDLLIHSLQLANYFETDLSQQFQKRNQSNAQRMSKLLG